MHVKLMQRSPRYRPYLYPARLFQVLDPREPADWVTDYGDDGERYAYPPPLNDPGFFEDFLDDRGFHPTFT
jgi:hypothetical protein